MQLFVQLILYTWVSSLQHHANKYDAYSLGCTALSPIIHDQEISEFFLACQYTVESFLLSFLSTPVQILTNAQVAK